MKVFIMTDLEGVSCASNERLWNRSMPEYQAARERLMIDLNTAIRACFDAGAEAVSCYDGHGGGGNFIDDELDVRAKHEISYEPEVFEGVNAFVMIGLHAKAGTQYAFLDHTQSSSSWFDYTVNGISYGEIAQDAAYCGAYGIPVVAISGDVAACEEARSIIDGIECAAVKKGLGRFSAECLPHDEAEKLIYDAVFKGVKKQAEIKLFTYPLPAEIRVTYISTDKCEEVLAWNKYVTRIDGRTVSKTITEIKTFYQIVP